MGPGHSPGISYRLRGVATRHPGQAPLQSGAGPARTFAQEGDDSLIVDKLSQIILARIGNLRRLHLPAVTHYDVGAEPLVDPQQQPQRQQPAGKKQWGLLAETAPTA